MDLLCGIRLRLTIRCRSRLLGVDLGLRGVGLGLGVGLGRVLRGGRVARSLVLDVAELGVLAVGVRDAGLDEHDEVDDGHDPIISGVS